MTASPIHFPLKASFILFVFFLASCQKENRFDCFKSTGKTVMEERFSSNFTGLDISDNINVFITESPETSIRIEAGKNIIGNITTVVKNDILYLKNENKCNWVRDYDRAINVYLKTNELNKISYRGFGKVKTIGSYTSQKFVVDMWMASGKMDLNLDCNSIFLKSHTGTANISCEGSANTVIVYMNGTGIIDAGKLESEYVLAINRDVGDVYVHATDQLDAEIFSRGDIFYTGAAGQINLVDEGAGNLIHYQ